MDILALAQQFVLWSQDIAVTWGYLGIFVVSILGNASIFLPVPVFVISFFAGAILNPWLVGISAGVGAAIGELTGYVLGIGGREVIKSKNKKWLSKAKKWSDNKGVFPVIILFAVTPLPYDIIGILAGIIKYDLKRFFLATVIGKVIINVILAWAGFYSVAWVAGVFGWV
jgi:membrane protein DedA with SNARE-associated domain